ncbi:hypothetical protein RvY_06342-2 [Ramazzottius varieornatus]|uniref:Uncharacterized protein n=1 Tax=Ramazzottius varieornatus TaxID=947166 RepID=A0A1D1V183_RAMVA|nr:hypothetical protein RvY_06342-2 [Ramazzottius varieornatus]
MGYPVLLHLSICAIVIQTTFADESLFKSFGLANDQPEDPEVDQRSDEAFSIVGLDTSDAQAAKRLQFLKEQIPNPLRNRLRFGSRLRETKQVEKISANKQLPPAIRRFFKLTQKKQSMDVTTTATDSSTGNSIVTPIVTLATRPPEATFSTATATETAATSVSSTTTPDATTTSTTTTPTTATTTTTAATPSTTTAQATTSSVTTQGSTETITYPASAATTPMMVSDSSTYSANSNAIADTNTIGSVVPSAAAKGKIRPFSNRVGSSNVHSIFKQVKLSEHVPLSDQVEEVKRRFALRLSQASSSSSYSSSPTEASITPTQEPTTIMSISSDNGYSDSTGADTTVTDATTSVVSAVFSEASSTDATATSAVLSASFEAGYYDSTDASSTVATTNSPEMSTGTSEASSTDAATTAAVSSVSSDGGYYDSADTSSSLTDTTSTASMGTLDVSSTIATATSSLSAATSSNRKSCKPDRGIQISAQRGVCASTMDLDSICEAMSPTFEAAQSTADCAAFDGNWCCYVPASIASKGRDVDGTEP